MELTQISTYLVGITLPQRVLGIARVASLPNALSYPGQSQWFFEAQEPSLSSLTPFPIMVLSSREYCSLLPGDVKIVNLVGLHTKGAAIELVSYLTAAAKFGDFVE